MTITIRDVASVNAVVIMPNILCLFREQKLLEQHLLLLASLDQQMMLLARHQRLIDVMTDTAADVSSDHV